MAKSAIDHGFSKVGRKLKADDPVERVLSGLAGRAIAMGNAVSLLCGRQHANEALPLLRSLLEISVRMRWIAETESTARAQEYIKEAGDPRWDSFLSEERLRARMGELGYSDALKAMTQTLCLEHLRANALGIPWGHVFEENKHSGRSGEDVTRAAGEAMAHVVMALHKRWGEFPGAEEILRAAEAVQQERKS